MRSSRRSREEGSPGTQPRRTHVADRRGLFPICQRTTWVTMVRERLLREVMGCGHREPRGEPLKLSGYVRNNVVAFSPDGKTAVTGGDDGDVRLWDATTGRQVGSSLQARSALTVLAFSRDGRTLLTGCDDGAILWDLDSLQSLGPHLHHLGGVSDAVFQPGRAEHPDGQHGRDGAAVGRRHRPAPLAAPQACIGRVERGLRR